MIKVPQQKVVRITCESGPFFAMWNIYPRDKQS